MFLVHLNIDSVDAFLNIVPGEELLTLSEGLSSQTDQCVCVSNKTKQPFNEVNNKLCFSVLYSVTSLFFSQ